jgi:LPXTG-site transpeptidase (sortase) family protein
MKKKNPQTVSKPELVDIYRKALITNTPIGKIEDKLEKLWSRSQLVNQVETKDGQQREQTLKKKIPSVVRYGALLLPIGFISLGMFLVGSAVIPIISFYTESLPMVASADLDAPIPTEDVLDIVPVVVAQAYGADFSGEGTGFNGPTIIDTKLDYTNLENWFGESSLAKFAADPTAPGADEYIIDVPSLNIKNALVRIGGTDLNQSLIQYPGTAEPGSAGAPVIFGHSVLPQFYNPSEKNPKRYVSVFTKIMSLKAGEDIFITKENVKYHYVMREKKEVKPEDVYILTQNYDANDLKLVTCTPPGTYLKRGVVVAELVK